MAVNHVILKEFYVDRQVPYFVDYLKRYTDSPVPGRARPSEAATYRAGQLLRANRARPLHGRRERRLEAAGLGRRKPASRACPRAQVGFRWGKEKGKWNLQPGGRPGRQPDRSGAVASSTSTTTVLQVGVRRVRLGQRRSRAGRAGAVRRDRARAASPVTTVFDLLMAQFGVGRGLPGDYPESYDDDVALHAGLAGAVHRHRPRDRDPLRPRVRRQRGGHRRASP